MLFGIAFLSCLVVALLIAILALILRSQSQKSKDPGPQEMLPTIMLAFQKEISGLKETVNAQVLDLSRQMNQHLAQNTQFLQETQHGYSETVGHVQHRLGQLQEATQSMMEIGRDISSLHQILSAPKLRGGFGELFLEELLKQILPEDHFALQHCFRDGSKVDAIIYLGQGLIPVDAKFPLENFKRIFDAKSEIDEKQARKNFFADVKKHIDAIAGKYILPEEGTFDFALMYIPAENVYYETIIKDDLAPESLATYAMRKKVIPVSPNSFYAYLQAIVRGLKGLRIERSAQLILENLGQLETDFNKFFAEFEKIGSHLGNAQSSYEKVSRKFERFHEKLVSLSHQQSASLPESSQIPVSQEN